MTTSSTFSLNPLGYEGIDLNSVANVLQIADRVPTSNDVQPQGTIWPYRTDPLTLYMSQGAGNWTQLVSSTGSLNTLTGNSGGAISPTSGNINILGGDGVTVSGSGSTLTINTSADTFTWNDAATSATMVVDNGYIITSGTQTMTLPATSVVGDEVIVVLNGGTAFIIGQNAGQTTYFGVDATTAGVTGTITTTGAGRSVLRLLCIADDTDWLVMSSVGNYVIA